MPDSGGDAKGRATEEPVLTDADLLVDIAENILLNESTHPQKFQRQDDQGNRVPTVAPDEPEETGRRQSRSHDGGGQPSAPPPREGTPRTSANEEPPSALLVMGRPRGAPFDTSGKGCEEINEAHIECDGSAQAPGGERRGEPSTSRPTTGVPATEKTLRETPVRPSEMHQLKLSGRATPEEPPLPLQPDGSRPMPRSFGDRGPSPTPSSHSSSRLSGTRMAPPQPPSPRTSRVGRSPFPGSGSSGQVIQANMKKVGARRSPSDMSRSSSQSLLPSHRSGTSSIKSGNIAELLATPEAQQPMGAMIQSMRIADREQIRAEIVTQMRAEIGHRQAAHAEEISELKNREANLKEERDIVAAQARSSSDEGRMVAERLQVLQ